MGATIDLGHQLEGETRLVRRKVEAGAQFFLLQALFDPLRLKEFLAGYAQRYGERLVAPVFCGVQVMTEDSLVFGEIPQWVTDDLGRGRSGEDIALQVLRSYVDEGFRSIYLVPPIRRGGARSYGAAREVLAGAGT
ncbi:MAG: hypothetical protein IIA70_09535 [Proteobacteria bacterium]|nr:hypothetical protein [Pseudomonadota bacterium]